MIDVSRKNALRVIRSFLRLYEERKDSVTDSEIVGATNCRDIDEHFVQAVMATLVLTGIVTDGYTTRPIYSIASKMVIDNSTLKSALLQHLRYLVAT